MGLPVPRAPNPFFLSTVIAAHRAVLEIMAGSFLWFSVP